MGGGAVWRLSTWGGCRARGSQLISPAASELLGSVVLLHKPAGRLGDPLTLESRGGGVPGPLPLLLPSSPGAGNGLRRPEDSLRGGSVDSGCQPYCWPLAMGTVFSYFKMKKLDWMTQNGSHGSGGRRGGKRYPSQLGTLSSLPGPAGLFALPQTLLGL